MVAKPKRALGKGRGIREKLVTKKELEVKRVDLGGKQKKQSENGGS